jgi:hypothetical protein
MTSLMEDFGTWAHLRHHPDGQAAPAAGTETAMTSPEPHSSLADVAEFVSELRANDLIERLYIDRKGSRLTAAQLEHVIAVIDAFEGPAFEAVAAAPETPQVMA